MWRGLRSAALGGLGCAAAARGCNRGIESLGTKERYRQIRWRKALYLEGKTRLTTSDLSPNEATHMSSQQFKGTFLSTGATINWSADQSGFHYQSNSPPDPNANLISVLGREQNGIFFM